MGTLSRLHVVGGDIYKPVGKKHPGKPVGKKIPGKPVEKFPGKPVEKWEPKSPFKFPRNVTRSAHQSESGAIQNSRNSYTKVMSYCLPTAYRPSSLDKFQRDRSMPGLNSYSMPESATRDTGHKATPMYA